MFKGIFEKKNILFIAVAICAQWMYDFNVEICDGYPDSLGSVYEMEWDQS